MAMRSRSEQDALAVLKTFHMIQDDYNDALVRRVMAHFPYSRGLLCQPWHDVRPFLKHFLKCFEKDVHTILTNVTNREEDDAATWSTACMAHVIAMTYSNWGKDVYC